MSFYVWDASYVDKNIIFIVKDVPGDNRWSFKLEAPGYSYSYHDGGNGCVYAHREDIIKVNSEEGEI